MGSDSVLRALAETGDLFVLLFAMLSVLPVLPVVLTLTQDLPNVQRRRALSAGLTTVAGTGFAVVVFGGAALRALGMEVADLRIAGGIILLVFSVYDLLFARVERKAQAQATDESLMIDDDEAIGVVPLGIPIMLGPGGMATLLVFSETHGLVPVTLAFTANLVINGFVLFNADWVRKHLGRAVIRALGKVMGVVLAALAVSMIRAGLASVLSPA